MKSLSVFGTLAVLSLVAPSLAAQYPIGAAGLFWSSSSGAFAGTLCWGFSCTADTVNVTAGETVSLRMSGEIGAPYLVLVGPSATSCQSFPGVLNSLVVDAPVSILTSGYLNSFTPILSCPSGYDTRTAVFPSGLPVGTTFAIQTLTFGAGFVPAFTLAIQVTVI